MKYLTSLLLICLAVTLVLPTDSTADETSQKKVMINEVYIDEQEPAKNWVEIKLAMGMD